MYTSGFLKTLSRRNDGSNSRPNLPAVGLPQQLAPHIADCIREKVDWSGSVLLLSETNSDDSCSTKANNIAEIRMENEKSRYKLWPRTTGSSSSSSSSSNFAETKDQALAIGRSPTSLSDTVIAESSHRGGSLLRRRNVSVPELKDKTTAKIIYAAEFADSPTIPGRPPLRKANTDMPGHERSASVPGTWRESPFGDAMLSAVAGPTIKSSPSKQARTRLAPLEQGNHFTHNKPLSPILSPTESKTPLTAIPRSPSRLPARAAGRSPSRSPAQSPSRSPLRSPALLQSPEIEPTQSRRDDVPPPVPPKDNLFDMTSPIRANTTVKRANTTKSHIRGKLSFGSVTEIPPMPLLSVQPPTRPAPAAPVHVSPTSRSDSTVYPKSRVASPDFSMMDQPRLNKASLRKQRSAPALPKVTLEPPTLEPKDAALLASAIEPQTGEGSLPIGLKPTEAVLVLPNSEKDIIRQQAIGQAENFEILGSKLVAQLSRELRALDERCDYLRKTYKSLRAGRQRLHSRMIAYLKSDSLTFSKERLLKQQEALIELDASIDDWVSKLEKAENRRLRLRQKLLEHVAASMTLDIPTKAVHSQAQTQHADPATPPRSPLRATSANSSPESFKQTDRKDVESIKIYADSISLYNDIEMAVTKMCEAC